MEDFLSYFYFGTSIPFGSLFLGLALLALGIGALFGLVRSFALTGGARVAGIVVTTPVFFLCVLALYANFRIGAELDLNPRFQTEEIAGVWSANRMALTVGDGDRATLTVPNGQNGELDGTWTRTSDFTFRFDSGPPDRVILDVRVVRYGETFRMLDNPPDDFDAWNGDLGLRRAQGR